jgi:hypothetical protein
MAAVSAGLVGPATRLVDPAVVLLVAAAVGYWVALVYWARAR